MTDLIQPLPSVADLYSPEQIGLALAVSTKTLANWRARGTGPDFVRVAGRIYYTREAYLRFWSEQTGGAA